MLCTWEEMPHARPSFNALQAHLGVMLKDAGVDVEQGVPTPFVQSSARGNENYHRRVPPNTDASIRSNNPSAVPLRPSARNPNYAGMDGARQNQETGTYLDCVKPSLTVNASAMTESFVNPSYLSLAPDGGYLVMPSLEGQNPSKPVSYLDIQGQADSYLHPHLGSNQKPPEKLLSAIQKCPEDPDYCSQL